VTTFVALLRGINVGKAKRIAMKDLRDLLTDLGYREVVTLLNSGNVVFKATKGTSTKHAAEIAKAISTALSIDVPVIVKSAQELAAIVSENSLAISAANFSYLLVAFVQDTKKLAALSAVEAQVAPPERCVVGKNAAYLYCSNGIAESKAASALLGKAGQTVTTRNWATVLKLQTLAGASV
jgi:uncharacterized protein (DUF1697 family)